MSILRWLAIEKTERLENNVVIPTSSISLDLLILAEGTIFV